MANFHSSNRGGGHGRGRGYMPLEFLESRSGKPPMKTWMYVTLQIGYLHLSL